DARLPGRAGIALGRMAGALLVADEDMLDRILLDDLVIDRQDRPPGVAEEMLHALVLQRLDDHFRAGHLAAIALPFHFATSLPGPSAVWPIKKALPGLSSRTTFRDGFRPSGRCAPELR